MARNASPGPTYEQRRARRLRVAMPVLLYGRLDREPFSEHVETINVSLTGGLIPISAQVVTSQKLILTNLQTNEELTCRVARIIRTEEGATYAGIEFLQPSPRFWGLDFVGKAAQAPANVPVG
ncbi:MAG TPA: PilZ domain-containing protein [Candidatus Acidoferrales bacterium]